jgi:FkbM family methyltransferase
MTLPQTARRIPRLYIYNSPLISPRLQYCQLQNPTGNKPMWWSRFQYIREITEHPLNRQEKFRAFRRYLAWNVGRRLLDEASYSIELIPGVNVVLSNRENYATLAYTCGLYDFDDMLFMMHLLRPNDCFGDFGSNVGVYSVLAGSRGAYVLAVEPVPDTYARLCANLRMNSIDATPVNCGLSNQPGTLTFTNDRGGMNKVSLRGGINTCNVEVTPVDELVHRTKCSPIMVKIDVEGYEHPLISGAGALLSSTLQAIIIEFNESGREFGYSDQSVHDLLTSAGFDPYRYLPASRELIAREGINRDSLNTIYVKREAVDDIRDRLRLAKPVKLRNGSI